MGSGLFLKGSPPGFLPRGQIPHSDNPHMIIVSERSPSPLGTFTALRPLRHRGGIGGFAAN